MLDKGQESDWFASSNITLFATLAAVALVAFVLWELRSENPVVDLRLFRNRNFAASTSMMLVLGIALYGSTVLLPQYEQVWLGYSAQQAGEALSPGGVIIILLMPLVGRLVSRVDNRWLIAFGYLVVSSSLFHMAHTLYPGIDFRTAVLLRVYQASGLAFLFVPINTIVYQGIPPEKNNAVSGIINLARNMGGDIGIAFVTTLIARRSQFHQARLVAGLDPGNPACRASLSALASAMQRVRRAPRRTRPGAPTAPWRRQLAQQAQTLAYLDVLFLLACFTADHGAARLPHPAGRAGRGRRWRIGTELAPPATRPVRLARPSALRPEAGHELAGPLPEDQVVGLGHAVERQRPGSHDLHVAGPGVGGQVPRRPPAPARAGAPGPGLLHEQHDGLAPDGVLGRRRRPRRRPRRRGAPARAFSTSPGKTWKPLGLMVSPERPASWRPRASYLPRSPV